MTCTESSVGCDVWRSCAVDPEEAVVASEVSSVGANNSSSVTLVQACFGKISPWRSEVNVAGANLAAHKGVVVVVDRNVNCIDLI